MSEGWIKLHRKILNWEWWDDHETFKVFIYLLLTANHADRTYRGQVVKRGEVRTSREKMATATGMTDRKIRTALSNLVTTKDIEIKATNRFSLISICSYDSYQSIAIENGQLFDQPNDQPNDQQTSNHQTRIKEDKKVDINKRNQTKERREMVFYAYKRYCPNLRQMSVITDTRKKHADRIWKRICNHDSDKSPEERLRLYFEICNSSAWMSGTAFGVKQGWKAGFDFVARDNTITQVIEGVYDSKK
jgi:hypothetical protein